VLRSDFTFLFHVMIGHHFPLFPEIRHLLILRSDIELKSDLFGGRCPISTKMSNDGGKSWLKSVDVRSQKSKWEKGGNGAGYKPWKLWSDTCGAWRLAARPFWQVVNPSLLRLLGTHISVYFSLAVKKI